MAIGANWSDCWAANSWSALAWVQDTLTDSTHAGTIFAGLNAAVLAIWGATTTFRLTDASQLSVTAIYDHNYVESGLINGYRPLLHCKTSDIATVTTGSEVKLNGVLHKVRVIEPDTGGMSRLILEKSQ